MITTKAEFLKFSIQSFCVNSIYPIQFHFSLGRYLSICPFITDKSISNFFFTADVDTYFHPSNNFPTTIINFYGYGSFNILVPFP